MNSEGRDAKDGLVDFDQFRGYVAVGLAGHCTTSDGEIAIEP